MKNTYFFTWSWLLVTSIATPLIAVTIIDTPHGQFSCSGGGTACTAIDMAASIQLLAMPAKTWHTIKPDQLAQLVTTGAQRYTQAINQLKKPAGLFFQAFEAAPAFPELQQAGIMSVLAVMPAPEFLTPGEQVTTPDLLALSIKQVKAPVCGVWTQHGSSQLICYKDNTWLFLDSHRQSTGAGGASIQVFDNEAEFQNFVNTHHVFHIGTESTWDQANVTLFRLNQATPKNITPQPAAPIPVAPVAPPSVVPQPITPPSAARVLALHMLDQAIAKKTAITTKLTKQIINNQKALKTIEITLKKFQGKQTKLTKELKKRLSIKQKRTLQNKLVTVNKTIAKAQKDKKALQKQLKAQQMVLKKANAEHAKLTQQRKTTQLKQKNLAALKHQAK